MKLVDDRKAQRLVHAEAKAKLEAKKQRGEQVTQAEIDNVNQIGNKVGKFSEEIAKMTLDRFLAGQGFIKIHPLEGMASSGAGDVDRVFAKEAGDRIQLFEVKGGASKPGSRIINDVSYVKPGSRAEQGTRPYAEQLSLTMQKSKDPQIVAMGEKLENALKEDMVDYLYFRQEFNAAGDLKPMTLDQFDIRNKTPQPNPKKK